MKKIFVAFFIASLFSGCLKGGDNDNTVTCNYNECQVVAPASEIQAVKDYLGTNSITATQHCSGMFYTIDDPGTGVAPTACNAVVITYEGRLTNGTVFDKPTDPVTLGLPDVITGFRNGLLKLKNGGKITLYIPPSLGYGNRQVGNIPPNSILIFKIELKNVL